MIPRRGREAVEIAGRDGENFRAVKPDVLERVIAHAAEFAAGARRTQGALQRADEVAHRPPRLPPTRGTARLRPARMPDQAVHGGAHATGWRTKRTYGFGARQPRGKCLRASSSDTDGTMMTSSPCCQLAGVASRCLLVSWIDSSRRRIS